MKRYILALFITLTLPSFLIAKTFTIKWVSSPNVDHYEIEISSDQSFSNPIVKNTATTSMELNTQELIESIKINNVFYVRIKAVFFTGQKPSYSPIREFKIQKIYQEVYTNLNGDIFLPKKFTLEFLRSKYQSPKYKYLKLYFRLGRKSKTYQYNPNTYLTCRAPSGKKEIFYYFANEKNRNRTKWQRIIVVVDKVAPKIKVSCGGKDITNAKYITAKPLDTIIVEAKDQHSGTHPNGSILFSIDQQNPLDKKIFTKYQNSISMDTLLNSLELNHKTSNEFTIYFKAIDNVGNISPIIGISVQYNPNY